MQQKHESIKATGTQLLAISPMLQKIAVSLVNKLDLKYKVLFDLGNNVAGKYGLAFRIAESLQPIYNKFGIDIPSTNGDSSYEVPLPATYIIDPEGIIRFSFVDVDHTTRLDPEIMIQEIAKI